MCLTSNEAESLQGCSHEKSSSNNSDSCAQKASTAGSAARTATLHVGEVDCHIIGVCHLSATSVEEARQAVQVLRPAAVCVELCEEREMMLEHSTTGGKVLPALSVSAFQEHWQMFLDPTFWIVHLQLMALEALLGMRLGAEQAAAYAAAQSVGSAVFLADRRQSITVARTIAALADFTALRELVQALRHGNDKLPGLVWEAAELELLVLKRNLSECEFERAADLARKMVDTLLNSPHDIYSLGRAGAPIQEERDYLLSHTLYHACCVVPPGSRVVAVLGAAHIEGVKRHFNSFSAHGCKTGGCGPSVEAEVQALHEVNLMPIYTAIGALLLTSCASVAGRWAFVRHLRRRRGVKWARRFNMASIALAGGLGTFALYRAHRQYEAVRGLQLRRHRCASLPHYSE